MYHTGCPWERRASTTNKGTSILSTLFKGLMPPMSFTESSRYSLKKSTIDGRTEIYLTPLELLDRLSKLRRAVIETAGKLPC